MPDKIKVRERTDEDGYVFAVYSDGSEELIAFPNGDGSMYRKGDAGWIDEVVIHGKRSGGSADSPNWLQSAWQNGDAQKNEQARQSWNQWMPKGSRDYSNATLFAQLDDKKGNGKAPKALQSKALGGDMPWQQLPFNPTPLQAYDGPDYNRDARIKQSISVIPRADHPYSRGEYVVREDDTLTDISKKFGVSIADLQVMNGIEDINKLAIGQILRVAPERDFTNNPRGGYSNPNNSVGREYTVDNMFAAGAQFFYGLGSENMIIVAGNSLDAIRNWDKVEERVNAGIKQFWENGKLVPGEAFSRPYTAPSLANYTKESLKGNEDFWTPIHVIGSFNFTMRVNADARTATVAVYDSKTISSLSDNFLGQDANSRNNANNGRGAFTTQYIRFIWKINLVK